MAPRPGPRESRNPRAVFRRDPSRPALSPGMQFPSLGSGGRGVHGEGLHQRVARGLFCRHWGARAFPAGSAVAGRLCEDPSLRRGRGGPSSG